MLCTLVTFIPDFLQNSPLSDAPAARRLADITVERRVQYASGPVFLLFVLLVGLAVTLGLSAELN